MLQCQKGRFQFGQGHNLDQRTQYLRQIRLQRSQTKGVHIARDLDQQVGIVARLLFTTGDGAKDGDVQQALQHQGRAVLAQPPDALAQEWRARFRTQTVNDTGDKARGPDTALSGMAFQVRHMGRVYVQGEEARLTNEVQFLYDRELQWEQNIITSI